MATLLSRDMAGKDCHTAMDCPPAKRDTGDMVVGAEIRRRREAMGKSLDDMGAVVGVSSSQLSRAERGERDLRVSELRRIAGYLKARPGDLFQDDDVGTDLGLPRRAPEKPDLVPRGPRDGPISLIRLARLVDWAAAELGEVDLSEDEVSALLLALIQDSREPPAPEVALPETDQLRLRASTLIRFALRRSR